MPIFEYRCTACDHLEEVLQKHSDPAPEVCPHCGKKKTLHKEISATSFQLKGGGWYKDLYASSSKKDAKPEKSEKSEAKKDSGTGGSSGGSSGSSGGSSDGGSKAAATTSASSSTSSTPSA